MLLHRSVRAPHVVHQDHRVGDLVQVHANRRLDEEIDADAAAVARLGDFQVPTQVARDEVRSVRQPARGTRVRTPSRSRSLGERQRGLGSDPAGAFRSHLRSATALEAIS